MSVSTPNEGLVPGVDAAIPPDFVCRLSIEQFHLMLGAGILTEDDPVELLDGWLVPKMIKNPAHRVVAELVRKALEGIVPEGWLVSSQDPITLAASEPEPDVAVVRGRLRDYLQRHPGPQEVALVVEVADASLQRDQTTKKRLYAQAGIPLYWIVDLLHRRIEVYSGPSGAVERPDYGQRCDFGPSDTVPVLVDARQVGAVEVAAVLP